MKRAVAAFISIGLLALLFWNVDREALLQNLRATRWGLFAVAIGLFVPQVLAIAWRWKRLVSPFAPLPLAESTRLVLAGATMNLVLPGKLGDLTKGWFLAKSGAISVPLGLGVVVFEKMLDVAALAAFMLAGVLLIFLDAWGGTQLPLPVGSLLLAAGLGVAAMVGVALLYFVPLNRLPGMGRLVRSAGRNERFAKVHRLLLASHATMDALRARDSKRSEILLFSLIIWALHLAQIYLFFHCLGAAPATSEFFAMVPLAIFVGLVPISIAGFGTRDAALVALLPGLPASAVLAAAMYINLRYIVPAIAGMPFLARYATLRKATGEISATVKPAAPNL